eukprot:CAMPEP_0180522118 /NCGR_PEP_ID=MMETSP1036_2-20121128/57236_1 /TAXON_ID=632150 /ORGANISM="Azadinium spinosum, Strain 3D9" /LENGTH=57 /DNA_ID=CAMNT_0022534873 /DNA_START=27 /DNA_END=200 /DNA_ORIENTATION=+
MATDRAAASASIITVGRGPPQASQMGGAATPSPLSSVHRGQAHCPKAAAAASASASE